MKRNRGDTCSRPPRAKLMQLSNKRTGVLVLTDPSDEPRRSRRGGGEQAQIFGFGFKTRIHKNRISNAGNKLSDADWTTLALSKHCSDEEGGDQLCHRCPSYSKR